MAARRNKSLLAGVIASLLAGHAFSVPVTAQEAIQSSADQPTSIQPIPGSEDPENISHNVVVLRALDKITARITELDVPVGKEVRFGTLALTAKYCRTRPPIEPPETYAYLQIDDIKRAGTRERVFDGWMVASSPALNPLEHPVYDVWVISCKTVSPEETSGNE